MLTPRKDPLTRLSMDAIAAREASIHLEILNSVIAKVVAERKGTSPATNHASPTVKHVVKRSVSPEDTIANVSADFWERAKKRVKSLVSNVREPRPAKNIDDDDHDFKKSNKSGRDSADDTSYDEFDEDDIDISEATHVPKEGRRAAAKVALAANARLAKLKLKHDQKRGQHTIRKTLTPEPKEIKKPLVRRLPSPPVGVSRQQSGGMLSLIQSHLIQRLISFPDIRWEPTVDQTERWRPLFPEKGLTYELHVINDFDESGPPGDFHFISEHILPRGDLLKIDPDFLVGCDCGRRVASTVDGAVAVVPCSEGAPCDCHSETAGLCPYDNEGRMALPSGTVITECNMNCACSIDTCKTRVVERGSTCKFLIFR